MGYFIKKPVHTLLDNEKEAKLDAEKLIEESKSSNVSKADRKKAVKDAKQKKEEE
jgi:hypothetical protein